MKCVDAVTLCLPIPPSVNRLYIGAGVKKRRHPTYVGWSEEAGWRIAEQRARGDCGSLPENQWYWTDIRLPQSHLGDSDNRLKAIHDILHQMQVTPDDKWLLGGTYMRSHDVEPGTCVIAAQSITQSRMNEIEQVRHLAARVLIATGSIEKLTLSEGA